MTETIVVLDFGSQYTQLIARRVRENNVFSRILPYNASFEQILESNPEGIILSGSPASVYAKGAPMPDKRIFEAGIPILGICYGMQLLSHTFGGKVLKSHKREYGLSVLKTHEQKTLFKGIPKAFNCWMSHGDKVTVLPKGFKILAHTANAPYAAMVHPQKQFYAIQFHAEVVHSQFGSQLFKNFLFNICKCKGNWTAKSFIDETVANIRKQVGKSRVVLGLSGGVDSSVAGVLIHKAIGKQLTCIFVDNGLLRLNEKQKVVKMFRDNFHMNVIVADSEKRFLANLKGVTDPEKKRKIIGKTFIDVFAAEAKKLGKVDFLAQGTLYPDVIESVSFHGGPSVTIKSHHNVGGLPKDLKFKLVEPLRELFKDEVREAGYKMGLSKEVIGRHPFPGPGLAVRILGEITKERCDLLRLADNIFIEEIQKAGLYDKIWQAFAVLLPVNSVGVMGDERTYENVCAVRAVTSVDGMTADWARIPDAVLAKVSNRIINEVRGINRVCYDISSKPPATIEWE